MSYGHLSLKQRGLLAPFVKGSRVHDIGAGDLRLSEVLLKLGASSVVAIDKELVRKTPSRRIRTVEKSYVEYPASEIEVAFISWPVLTYGEEAPVLASYIRHIPQVVYLGKNTDGIACGGMELFAHLVCRKIEVYAPTQSNTLIVYGPLIDKARPIRGEELAGLTGPERIWMYSDVEGPV